jgi:hypothetical protein
MQFGTIQIMVQYSVKDVTFGSQKTVTKKQIVMQYFRLLTTVAINTRKVRKVILPSAEQSKDSISE